jgi:hypothetical protein
MADNPPGRDIRLGASVSGGFRFVVDFVEKR